MTTTAVLNDELRRLVVQAGLEVLDADGLGLRPDSITYANAFSFLQEEHDTLITRGSIHNRIWDSQDDYRAEVLTAAANHTSPYEDAETMHRFIVDLLCRVTAESDDPSERTAAFCRISGRALLGVYLGSSRFRRFQAIKAAARLESEGDGAGPSLRSIIGERIDGTSEERLRRLGFAFPALGLRPKAEHGLSFEDCVDIFMISIQMLVTGSHLDCSAGFDAMASDVETGFATDPDEPWNYLGFGLLAMVNLLFEPDDDLPTVRSAEGDFDDLVPDLPVGNDSVDRSTFQSDGIRRTRDELRRLVVAAGVEIFLRQGLSLRPQNLAYSAVFAHIKETRNIRIHRATVHPRLWASQEEFAAEVLAEATRYGTDETLIAMRQAMAAQRVTLDGDGAVDVDQLIRDNVLATTEAQMMVAATSPVFNRWQLIKATMLSPTPNPYREGIQNAVRENYTDTIDTMIGIYGQTLPLVGLAANPELEISSDRAYHLLAVLAAAISSGSDYNIAAGGMVANRSYVLPRNDGGSDKWPLPSIATRAVLELLFKPVG